MFRGVWDGVHPVAVKRFKGTLLEGRFDISNELEVLKLCRCVGLPVGCSQHAMMASDTTNPSESYCAHVWGSLFCVLCCGLKVVHLQVALPDSGRECPPKRTMST